MVATLLIAVLVAIATVAVLLAHQAGAQDRALPGDGGPAAAAAVDRPAATALDG